MSEGGNYAVERQRIICPGTSVRRTREGFCERAPDAHGRGSDRTHVPLAPRSLKEDPRSSRQMVLKTTAIAADRSWAWLRRLLGHAVSVSLVGCRMLLPWPDTRTPVDRAREIEDKCKHVAVVEAAGAASPGVIDSVEPAYSYVSAGPADRAAHLRGARIHLRPSPAASRESLQRSLECHQVQVTLGAAQALADDPYVLPGRWVDIDVDSEGDGFVAQVRVDRFDDAREVLDRARRFAHARQ